MAPHLEGEVGGAPGVESDVLRQSCYTRFYTSTHHSTSSHAFPNVRLACKTIALWLFVVIARAAIMMHTRLFPLKTVRHTASDGRRVEPSVFHAFTGSKSVTPHRAYEAQILLLARPQQLSSISTIRPSPRRIRTTQRCLLEIMQCRLSTAMWRYEA